jgi:hypothetical protein
MKINKQVNSKKYLIIPGIIICLALLAGGIYFFVVAQTSTPPAANNDAQNAADKTIPSTKNGTPASSPDVDNTKTTDNIPVSKETTVTIKNLVQQDGSITYSATVENYGESGTCSATFTNDNDRPVVRTTAAEQSNCGPITIPEAEFSTLGKWTLTLRYYTNNTQAIATQTIEIK